MRERKRKREREIVSLSTLCVYNRLGKVAKYKSVQLLVVAQEKGTGFVF